MKRPTLYRPKHKAVGRTFNGRKAIDEMYDSQWSKYREKFLEINSKCYRCGEHATVVDHLIPHKGDDNLFKKLDNHIPLCKRCHDTCTGLFDRKYRIGATVDPKIAWMHAKRFSLGLSFKVKVLPNYHVK